MSTCTIDGIDTYYTSAGDTGSPVVLLHGGLTDGASWGPLTTMLAESHRVFVPDRRGHGRTPDTDEAFSYDAMAAETIAFCEDVVGEPANLVGWSDGGIIALLLSISRPDLVVRQVTIGANFHFSGLIPGELGTGDSPDDEEVAFVKAMFEADAPDGAARWSTFWAKTGELWRTGPTLTTADLAEISTPTLVMVGDDEPIQLSHTVELFESLPDADLCVVPGASHDAPLEQTGLVFGVIDRFLTGPRPPETFAPIRRRTD
ncbi:MAG: alpha/beta hydrolase [Actinobacteria bacterium]|nr:alpha/beta hydrolase [Actinomycetota bacterium]